MDAENARNGVNSAEPADAVEACRVETEPPQPEPKPDPDAALKLAIKAAVDAGNWPRAEALMAVLSACGRGPG